MGMGSFWRDQNVLELDSDDVCTNLLKVTELYTSKNKLMN